METKKIALACFLGGSVFIALVLMLTPDYWWLGLISGIAGGFTAGYLGYDIREVVRKIPIILRQMKNSAKSEVLEIYNNTVSNVKDFFKPHPFMHFTIALALLIAACWFATWTDTNFLLSDLKNVSFSRLAMQIFLVFLLVGGLSLPSAIVSAIVIGTFATIGSRFGEKCYWFPFLMAEGNHAEECEKELVDKGYAKKQMTYASLFRWTLKGVGVVIKFFVWTMWKYILIFITKLIIPFCLEFIWKMLISIHSKKRILCGIDGVLGGAIAFCYSLGMDLTTIEKVMLIFFGGILGAVIGILDYEIVSKRILALDKPIQN